MDKSLLDYTLDVLFFMATCVCLSGMTYTFMVWSTAP